MASKLEEITDIFNNFTLSTGSLAPNIFIAAIYP